MSGKRTFLVEPLEARNLLAGDLFEALAFANGADSEPEAFDVSQSALLSDSVGFTAVATSGAQIPMGEGESAPDLVAFAKALTQAGTKYFTAAWCPHCNAQKAMFDDGANYLNAIEVTNPDRTLNEVGTANNITSFPTWEFPDGTRISGLQTLQTISERAGVAIPTSDTPSLKPIGPLTVLGGSPLHVPLDGYDPLGGALTYTVTSTNPALVEPVLLQGNRSMEIVVQGWGSMVFQLFEDRASRPTGRVVELAEADFYNDIIFHRVIKDFVIQGGDPTGTGTGGSGRGTFDDQFHVDLQHNRAGLLSYAKSTDDTNDSQFFVTLAPARWLDFNHSIFGILVEGNSVLQAIGNSATTSGDRPIYDIVIDTVRIFDDQENAVVMLKAPEGASGQANVTVTVTNSLGNSVQETLQVTVEPDPYDGGPFLLDIEPLTTTMNTPVNLQLVAVDVEGDPVYYDAAAVPNAQYTFTVNHETGLVTVTPEAGFVGTTEIIVAVRALHGADTADEWDRQAVPLTVLAGAPEQPATPVLELREDSDSNIPGDYVTNVTNLQFRVSNVAAGATVQISYGETVIGQGTAVGNTIDITTNNLAVIGDGVYSLNAAQTVDGVRSENSTPIVVTLDTTPPPAFTSTPPTSAIAGHLLTYNAQNPEEGTTGFRYSLVAAPEGATIDPLTGLLSWTPSANQEGGNSFQIRGTDLAGNSTDQTLNINVSVIPQEIRIRLATADLEGVPISTVSPGDEFLIQVFVQDIQPNAKGVFAAYLDVTYDPSLVSVAVPSIVYSDPYENGQSGNLTVPGLIDEAGAFAGFTQTGAAERLLFSVRMVADRAGQAQFRGDPADGVGNQMLVYGKDDPVAWEAVTFLPTTLLITSPVIAVDDLFNVDEDSPNTTLDVLANDINETGGALTITAVGPTSHGGTVTIAANGQSVLYRPAANFFGEDTFTYTVQSGDATSVATVTVQVHPVNDPPTANDDTFTIGADTQQNFLDVLANDSFAPDEDETLRIISVGTPSQGGVVTIAPNGTHLLYTPKAGFGGTETFTYTISDRPGADGLTDTATVTVTVEAGPTPTASPDTAVVNEDAPFTVIDVLANDTPGEAGGVLRVTAVSAGSHGGSTLVGGNGANVQYKPAPGFFGTETFTYTVTEVGGRSATGTVTVTVNPVYDPPMANDDTFTVPKNAEQYALDVLANDTFDPHFGQTLTIVAVTQGSQGGTMQVAADKRSVLYTPVAGFTGTETFTYTIDDGSGEQSSTDQATVTISVLEYTPRSIGGLVSANGFSLGGMTIDLLRPDESSNTIFKSTVSLADGTYAFSDLAPGSYRVHTNYAATPRFLIVQPNTIDIQSDFSEGDSTGNHFALPGRKAQFLTIADLLVTAPGQSSLSPPDSVTVAVEPGRTQDWYSISAGWSGYKQMSLQLSSDRSRITLTATNSQDQQFSGSLEATNANLVKWLGREDGAYLIRIDAGPSHFGMQPAANAAASGGEGESFVFSTLHAPSPSTGGEIFGGEGESSVFTSATTSSSATAPVTYSAVPTQRSAVGTAAAVAPATSSSAAVAPISGAMLPEGESAPRPAATVSAPSSATITDTGWFVAPLEGTYGNQDEGESGTAASGVLDTSVVDVVLARNDFGAETSDGETRTTVSATTDEDDYAIAVDVLMTEGSELLAEWA